MKRFFLCLLSVFLAWSPATTGAPREADWKKIDKLVEKKLPQSAIAALVKMEAAALAKKEWPEAVRALAARILIESGIEADKPDGRLTRIESAIANAPAEMLPVLQTLAAEWFYEYFDSNRWNIMQRTAGAGGADIATWGLQRVLAEIDARFQKALSHAPVLRQTPIAQWEGLLKAGKLPDSYQPTLYDFFAGEALAFYTMVEQAGAAEEDEFEFTESSPALGSMDEFLAWQPGPGSSSDLKAIRLYHEVLSFHKDDADPGALVMVDLQRLEWVRRMTNSDAADARALQQFTALYQKHAAHEISLRARSLAAHLLDKDDRPAEARKSLQEGVAAFGKSVFVLRCRNQIKGIEHRELGVGTELIWNAAQPEIVMTYRNLKKVFFRLYAVSENPQMPGVLEERYVHGKTLKRMLQKKPVRAWQVDLPPADDFREHKHRVPAPVDLKPGYYLLCASGNVGFGAKDNMIAATYVWVTPLALVTRKREIPGAFTLDGWVLDAVSGEPLKGAEVTLWQREGNDPKMKKTGTATSGEDGFVSFSPKTPTWGHAMLFARQGKNVALSGESTIPMEYPSKWDGNTTFFFTDRAIYRPGQTIRFKGIRVQLNKDGKGYRTVPDVKRHIALYDANSREVAAVDSVTNEFGSFSGSFTAPQQGLTGEFTIYDGDGRAGVHIEEYKRPKFRVELDPPAAAPKLGEEVAMKIKALAYTGAPVDGAGVKWRVTREARWPSWSGFRESSDQEIAHGSTKTGPDGSAEVKFTAVPDKDADEKSEPWFVYQVHADITDPAGETRSAERSLSAGYAAMQAELEADDWQSTAVPAAITARTTTLDGEPLQAEGTLTVHRLVQPEKVHRKVATKRDSLSPGWDYFRGRFRHRETESDLADPELWEFGEAVQRDNVQTGAKGASKVNVRLTAGAYRAMLETKDRFGRKVTARKGVIVIDPDAKKFPARVPFWLGAPSWELQPGGEFAAQWGTGYDKGRAFIEIEHRGKIVERFWTDAGRTQQGVAFTVNEEHRGGFTLHVTQMQENRLSEVTRFISVPWSNKDLNLKWEHLSSKLEPGAKDTWTLTVEGPDKQKTAAEFAAVLYDASLDALTPHEWIQRFDCFPGNATERTVVLAQNGEFQTLYGEVNDWWGPYVKLDDSRRGWSWLTDDGYAPFRASIYGSGSEDFALLRMQAGYSNEFNPVHLPQTFGGSGPSAIGFSPEREESAQAYQSGPPRPDTAKNSARRNMQETAFFFPHLTTAEDGTVKMSFTMPESVTTWKFLGFAHDKELRSGFLSGETVTARDLMVQPNPPRFLREGDTVEFTVKITNQNAAPQRGTAQLSFCDAATLALADAALGNQKLQQEFILPAKESRTLSWRITVPDGQGFLTWKAVAVTERMTDGEEGWLPVLPRRIPVTESLPLPMRDAGEREFALKKLMESTGSQTLRHQSLTVQMVSQPAWYAVMALPYLMEYPHECSEQTFNRFYSNALARHIATSDPKIRRVFNLWRDAQPDAMKSPLEKNPDLKSLMIEETPWLREAQKESQRNLGILFDDNRLHSELDHLLKRLGELQSEDGAWPWFPGGPGSDFITLYLVAGFGRLKHLGVEMEVGTQLALKAMDRLDGWLADEYRDIVKHKAKGADNFSSTVALYLYGRSFFLGQRPVPGEQKPAVDYFLDQARKHWTSVPRMSQAHAALGLLRFGDEKTPAGILASLKERSISNEDTGLYWADEPGQWLWNRAPVETQALMIEAFRDIAKDEKTVDDCQVWLLKQKQTQAWPTTKATADAVYALLLGGTSQLGSDALVTVSLGGKALKPENVEAGTGFFEKKFAPAEINAGMGHVKLVKTDKGVSWGTLHWQYMEDMSKITPHEGTPLKVTKALFIKVNPAAGPELRPVTGKVKVGDELVVRLEIRTDRDMEFVHLKDQRPSSVEPVNVLSQYQWQDGLGYYESTRDTASHFFFDALPKGTYVFEYSARVQLRGQCQAGIAELQCMYAPEFASHSASAVLEVE